jgi:hypothetical protein
MEVAVGAKHELRVVFGLIRGKKYWFSAPSRSVYEVVRVYNASGNSKTEDEAKDFILGGVLSLTDAHFYGSGTQWEMVVDIYGLIFDGHHWFVKLGVTNEEENGVIEPLLHEISFHPADKDFTTVGGFKIKAGV